MVYKDIGEEMLEHAFEGEIFLDIFSVKLFYHGLLCIKHTNLNLYLKVQKVQSILTIVLGILQ